MGFRESFARESASDNVLGYDDTASCYFGCFVLVLVALPWTWHFVKTKLVVSPAWLSSSKSIPTTIDRCRCSLCEQAADDRNEQAQQHWRCSTRSLSTLGQACAITMLWVAFCLLLQKIRGQELITTFDPWDILELARGADAREIRKAYRTLSLKLHPDRNAGDPVAAARFILVAKAYRTLTDDTARLNFEKYGNPDGPGFLKIGIGLPQFFVRKENQLLILLCFFFVLLVVVPYSFVRHYRQGALYAPNGLRYETTTTIASKMTKEMRVKQIYELMALSAESKYNTSWRRPDEEQQLVQLDELLGEGLLKCKNPFSTDQQLQRNYLLLLAQAQAKRHLLTKWQTLQLDYVLRSSDLIVRTMMEIAAFQKWSALQHIILEAGRSLVQGRQLTAPVLSLLQIPHFDTAAVNRAIKGRNAVRDLRHFVESGSRRGCESLTPEQMADVEEFCLKVPLMKLEASVFVEGENDISQNDIITIKLSFTRTNLRDGDGGKAPLVHCPAWPFTRSERWYIVVSEAHTGEAVAFQELEDDSKFAEVRIQRPAANKGKQAYRVHAYCTSYAGLDVSTLIEFKVLQSRSEVYWTHPEDIVLDSMPSLWQTILGMASSQPEDHDDDDVDESSYYKAG